MNLICAGSQVPACTKLPHCFGSKKRRFFTSIKHHLKIVGKALAFEAIQKPQKHGHSARVVICTRGFPRRYHSALRAELFRAAPPECEPKNFGTQLLAHPSIPGSLVQNLWRESSQTSSMVSIHRSPDAFRKPGIASCCTWCRRYVSIKS